MQKMCKYTDLNKAFCSTSGFLILIFVCCVMSWSLGRGRGKHCTLCQVQGGEAIVCHVCCGCLCFFWFERGGGGYRPCLCLLVGAGGLHTFSVCGGWGHFRPEPFAHLRKPWVFGPLGYSGSGVDRKPLACEDANNGVDRIPLTCEDALYWSFSCDFIENPLWDDSFRRTREKCLLKLYLLLFFTTADSDF